MSHQSKFSKCQFFLPLLIGLCSILLFSCSTPKIIKGEAIIFNTLCRIQFQSCDGADEKLLYDCFADLEKLYQEIDVVSENSQLNLAIQEGMQTGKIVLKGEAAHLLKYGLELARLSNGALDPTIAPLVQLWKIGMGGTTVPSQSEIEKTKISVGYEKIGVEFSETESGPLAEIKKWPKGFRLDFGALGKGLAAQKIESKMRETGVTSALIQIGGNVTAIGEHPDKRDWVIGLQDPKRERGQYMAYINLADISASTSGNYERYFEVDGKRYHHILSRKTGFPVESNLLSVTVLSPNALDTDGFSTILYALPQKEAFQWVLNSENECEAIFAYANGEIWATQGAKERLFFMEGEEKVVHLISESSF